MNIYKELLARWMKCGRNQTRQRELKAETQELLARKAGRPRSTATPEEQIEARRAKDRERKRVR